MNKRLFILSQYLLPHHLLSRLAGCIAECRVRWFKNAFTAWFAKRYQVDMSQALVEYLTANEHLNPFYTRAMKDGARPLDETPGAILSPADGAVSQLGPIEHGRVFQAKGHSFSVLELLGGDAANAAPFMGGDFATIYLSPKDYHRVHMPLAGTLREMVYIPGRIFSVNQTTAENVPELFAFFLGVLGVDRFWLGETGLGIAKFITCGGAGIWTLIDWFTAMNRAKMYNYNKLMMYF